ncbi:unnamed protein product [Arabis nemorensis]|uniref:Uncharacterized protein n=1 Tax=Arabis nemorensis TaxID=586526 RepID=A0A565BXC0_9BRAS|nr:unnamed protein product [Arabis nemorensis]
MEHLYEYFKPFGSGGETSLEFFSLKTDCNIFVSVCCGALAGAISASRTTPLDVVKTRLMTQIHVAAANELGAAMYTGVAGTVIPILKEEGLVGFTRGMGLHVVHIGSAIGYFAF